MPQRAPTSSNLMRPFVVLALPGMYLLYKYNQYRQQQMETARRRVTERELMHLNTKICKKEVCDQKEPKQIALPAPSEKKLPPVPAPRPGVQVSVLGADTSIGQYIALLLKQCSCIKKLRLYEAKDNHGCNRDLCSVVQDLQHINTNCLVQAFSCACYELERCLQNTDIVLILESGYLNVDMPFEKRFEYQAPIVKCYADAIANECPKAFIIVCATPIDCMVPLIAETLKETGWYDPNKLLGSMAVPEMRASTLAARALCLEPRYCRVPCVGGTEGESLVPLFSKAVEYFDFAENNATMMTEAVRHAPVAVSRNDGPCTRVGDLSEAHALAGLVTAVAHGLLCHDIPRVTGFVETDLGHVISPARFIASTVEIGGKGIRKHLGLPKMNDFETVYVDKALNNLCYKQRLVYDWYCRYHCSSTRLDTCQFEFFHPRHYAKFVDCAYIATDVLLNHKGICKRFVFPRNLNAYELNSLDWAFSRVICSCDMALDWYKQSLDCAVESGKAKMMKNFNLPKYYDRITTCSKNLLG